MPRSDHERLGDVEARLRSVSGGGGGTVVVTTGGGGGSSGSGLTVQVNGVTVGNRGAVNFISDGSLNVTGIDNANSGAINVLLGQAANVQGWVDVGAGMAAGAGYTLSATNWMVLDSANDFVIPASVGLEVEFDFSGVVTAATGDVYFTVLAKNSGNQLGETTVGWPSAVVRAGQTKVPHRWAAWYQTVNTDIVNGSATFQLLYKLSATGGSPFLYANDTEGHYRARAKTLGQITVATGQNTGQPPVTPPSAGVFTDRGTVTTIAATTATATKTSATFTPTAGDVVWAFIGLHIEGVDSSTVACSMTDSFGDSGGSKTSWSQRAKIAVAAPNAANSNSLWLFSRMIGNTPSAGVIRASRNAGTFYEDFLLSCLETSGVLETPDQSPTPVQGVNVSTLGTSLTQRNTSYAVLTAVANVTPASAPPAPTVPSDGSGTWVALYDSSQDDIGWGFAYQASGMGSAATWRSLQADAATSISFAVALAPSGATTAAPGTESWNTSSKTSNINADISNWVQHTT